MNSLSSILTSSIGNFTKIIDLTSRSKQAIDSSLSKLPSQDGLKQSIETQIQNIFDQIIQSLQKQMKELISEVRLKTINHIQQIQYNLQNLQKKIQEIESQAKENLTQLKLSEKKKDLTSKYFLLQDSTVSSLNQQLNQILEDKDFSEIPNLEKIIELTFSSEKINLRDSISYRIGQTSFNSLLHFIPCDSHELHLYDVVRKQHKCLTLSNSSFQAQAYSCSIKLGKLIFICGGNKFKGDNWVFDLEDNLLRQKAPMIYKVAGHALAEYQKHFYSIGGADGANNYRDTVEKYSIHCDKWIHCPKLTEKRYSPGAASIGGRFIYAIGGHDGIKYLGTIEMMDAQNQNKGWSRILFSHSKQWSPRNGIFCIEFSTSQILICGGFYFYKGNALMDDIFLFNGEKKEIKNLKERLKLQSKTRYSSSRCSGLLVNGEVYFIMHDKSLHIVSEQNSQIIKWDQWTK